MLPLLGIHPIELKILIYSCKCLYTNIRSTTIYSNKKVEKTHMSTDGQMDKHNVVFPSNGLLFSHKKGWSTDRYYSMDEPWKHYTN